MTGLGKVKTDLCQGKVPAQDMTPRRELLLVKMFYFRPSYAVTLGLRVCKAATQGPPILSGLVCGPSSST